MSLQRQGEKTVWCCAVVWESFEVIRTSFWVWACNRIGARVESIRKVRLKLLPLSCWWWRRAFRFYIPGGKEREKKKVSAFVCFLTSMYEKLFRLILFSHKNWQKLLGGRASQGGENNKYSPPQNGMVEEGIPPPPLLLYSTILRRVCTWERALCSARHSTCWRASR